MNLIVYCYDFVKLYKFTFDLYYFQYQIQFDKLDGWVACQTCFTFVRS